MEAAILTAAVLLLAGYGLRARLRVLQWMFVPASVTGGLLGLLLIQAGLQQPDWSGEVRQLAATLRAWPSWLIAVVFAGLLLEPSRRRLSASLRGAALNGIMVWVIVLGQLVLGLAAAWLFILPAYDVPPAFGQLLEAGFAGGHGTATALGTILREVLHFDAGLDLGLFMATVGIVYSVISGIVLVNIGVRRGWTRSRPSDLAPRAGPEQRPQPRPIGWARVRSEVIDPLAFQIVLVALAFLLGVLFRWAATAAVQQLGTSASYLTHIPLFLFTLLGGWALRGGMAFWGWDHLIDGESIRRIVAVAMEFLIVAGIASVRVEVVATFLGPLLLLCLVGFVWTAVCVLVLAPILLPREHWFELGLINYGMSTGTTAQGMMLLRIVDEDLESGAAEDYALAAPLSAPFIGGGVLTMSLPLLLEKVSLPAVIGVLGVAVVGLIVVGQWLNRTRLGVKDPPSG
ncbi:MAG: sodium:glutamate symporter [Planctomycetales bacterium]|nr:sodium:glutamate symporter [Planctomycetales bacterium]